MWAHGSESTSHCAKHHHIIMEVNAPLPASVTIIAYEATAVTASAAAVSRIAASADANSADLRSCRLLCRLFGLQSILGAPCYEVLLRRCPTIEVPTETGEYIPSTRPEVYDGTTVAFKHCDGGWFERCRKDSDLRDDIRVMRYEFQGWRAGVGRWGNSHECMRACMRDLMACMHMAFV